MNDVSQPPSKSWTTREMDRRPRLVIFDDSMGELQMIAEEYRQRGFDVVGVPVLYWWDKKYLGEDLVLDRAAILRDQESSTTDTMKEHYGDFLAFERAIHSPDQLQQILDIVKPDAILSDRDMPETGFTTGLNLLDALPDEYKTLPKIIHTGGDEDDVKFKEQASKGGYGIVHKRSDDQGKPFPAARYLQQEMAQKGFIMGQ